jgi:hypothetical protein
MIHPRVRPRGAGSAGLQKKKPRIRNSPLNSNLSTHRKVSKKSELHFSGTANATDSSAGGQQIEFLFHDALGQRRYERWVRGGVE